MALLQPFYINGPSLASATAVFQDALMTICAADGFYSDGSVVREQVGCVLLPQNTCPTCCDDICTSWTYDTTGVGCGTVTYTVCSTTSGITDSIDICDDITEFCALKGTIPTTEGGGVLQIKQTCGCCADCSTWAVKVSSGNLDVSWVDCDGNFNSKSFSDFEFICVKSGQHPTIEGGLGQADWYGCGCRI